MRISEQQRQLAVARLRECFGPDSVIWLFGSRVEDRRRGGDVDLYVEAEQEPDAGRLTAEMAVAIDLEDLFEGVSVDLLVRYPGDAERPIHRIAKQRGLLL
ncbi:nucleotidyltransferase domain-containing protein [Thioalkalicoccus limnaeus]|uniref:Nucleotidyltransferase domain-containing protein n=1 Tax=Thioalkalicoccus limnaeus TaxID=120681 RepID=A0ABV4BIJ9_9GAMM